MSGQHSLKTAPPSESTTPHHHHQEGTDEPPEPLPVLEEDESEEAVLVTEAGRCGTGFVVSVVAADAGSRWSGEGRGEGGAPGSALR